MSISRPLAMWCGTLLVLAWLTPHPPAYGGRESPARKTVRIGLFGLYKPQSLFIQLDRQSSLVSEVDGKLTVRHPNSVAAVEIRRQGQNLWIRYLPATYSLDRVEAANRITLSTPSGTHPAGWKVSIDDGRLDRNVRGDLCIRIVRGTIQVVLTSDVDSVVARVVASEMSGIPEPEALKALAIVTRTFIHTGRGRHSDDGFDLCDTTHCLWYQGEDRLDLNDRFAELAKRAASETKGSVLSRQGLICPAYFTATCGGALAQPEAVWGGKGTCGPTKGPVRMCQWCRGSAFFRWQRRIDKEDFLDAVADLIGFLPSRQVQVVAQDSEEGFVRWVRIRDGQRELLLRADDIRLHLGRRLGWNQVMSNAYTIRDEGAWLGFSGRGSGHNVGLCLTGAAAQARDGRSYEDILAYYFPLSTIGAVSGL